MQNGTLGILGPTGVGNLRFRPGGKGGRTRTAQSKLREVISVLDFGADPTGVADSTAAIQAAIDFASSVITARATVHIPSSWLGNSYRIATPLTWKANVNILCDPSVRIFASASMVAMLQTGVGSSAVRLRSVWLRGGRWDGNYLARRGFWIKDGNGVHLSDFHIVSVGTYVDGTTETESSYIRIGDPGQFTSCYEMMIDNFGLYRTDDASSPTAAPALNYGVFSTDGASDCHASNGVISGVKFGMADEMAHWKVNFVHVWNFQTAHGALVNGFYETIGGVTYHGCQVDCATYEIPFRFDGTAHPNNMVGCQINCSLDTASSSDNVGLAVSVGSGVQLTAVGNVITCDVTKRFAVDFSGSLALLTTHGHQNKNVVSPVANSGVVTPDGRVIAGHTAPVVGPTGVTAKVQAHGIDANAASLMARFSANASPGRISLAKSRGATVGDFTIVQSGDSLGELLFMGSNGTDFQNAALISAEVDGTPGAAADMPGRLLFKTSPDGSSTPAERFRLDSTGKLTGISPLGGLGYGTGAGGTQTQGTSKATTVVLNTVCGQLTLNGAILNANTGVTFTFTNSAIAATDQIVWNHRSGGTIGAYAINATCAAGSATVTLRNITAGNLTETPVYDFFVLKSVVS